MALFMLAAATALFANRAPTALVPISIKLLYEAQPSALPPSSAAACRAATAVVHAAIDVSKEYEIDYS